MDASARGRLLLKLAELLERDAKYLAELETLDNGKPVKDATGDVQFGVSLARFFGGKADKIQGSTIPTGG